MDDDVELEVASGSHDPEPLLDFIVADALGAEAIEEAFDVFTSEHSVLVDDQMSCPYVGSPQLFLGLSWRTGVRRAQATRNVGSSWRVAAR
jgi:hypothetical protein